MINSVSKYIGIDRLKQIKQDHCLGAAGQEYCAYELDDMINARMASLGEREYQEYLELEAQRCASEFTDCGIDPEMFFSEKPAYFVHKKQLLVSKAYMKSFQDSRQYIFHVYGDGIRQLVVSTSVWELLGQLNRIDDRYAKNVRVEYVGTKKQFEQMIGETIK